MHLCVCDHMWGKTGLGTYFSRHVNATRASNTSMEVPMQFFITEMAIRAGTWRWGKKYISTKQPTSVNQTTVGRHRTWEYGAQKTRDIDEKINTLETTIKCCKNVLQKRCIYFGNHRAKAII